MVHQVELGLGARGRRQLVYLRQSALPSILVAFGIAIVIAPVTGQAER